MKIDLPKNVVKGVACALIAIAPLAGGCSEASEETKGKSPEEQTRPSPDKPRYLPYSIRFDLNGNPVVVDERGKVAELEEVKLPVKATELVDVQTISVVTYAGSCVQLYNIGGKLYAISLPDYACKPK